MSISVPRYGVSTLDIPGQTGPKNSLPAAAPATKMLFESSAFKEPADIPGDMKINQKMHTALKDIASDENSFMKFMGKVTKSVGLSGQKGGTAAAALESIRQDVLSGNDWMPSVAIGDAKNFQSGFVHDNGKGVIVIDKDLSDTEKSFAYWEAMGHAFDHKLGGSKGADKGGTDSPGDEGERFLRQLAKSAGLVDPPHKGKDMGETNTLRNDDLSSLFTYKPGKPKEIVFDGKTVTAEVEKNAIDQPDRIDKNPSPRGPFVLV